MKQILIVCAALLAALFLIPLLTAPSEPLALAAVPQTVTPDKPDMPDETAEVTPSITPAPSAVTPTDKDDSIPVTVLINGESWQIPLGEFLAGVLAAEMPASYPQEALRAQAVAARSMILWLRETGHFHPDADICSDPSHCLGYVSLAAAASAWGNNSEEYTNGILAAVADTEGQTLTYNGEICQALFFAVSSGKTENAGDIWSENVPYLISVDSPWDKSSPKYEQQFVFTQSKLRGLLEESFPGINLQSDASRWFTGSERTASGSIMNLVIGGTTIQGSELRSLLSLASQNFTVKAENGSVTFTTLGYGHGVGLSQYGAAEMAKEGKTYEEILSWYYPGTEIGMSVYAG